MATDDVAETLRLIDELCAEGAYPEAAALMGPLLAELDAGPESPALGMALRADAQLQQCLGHLDDARDSAARAVTLLDGEKGAELDLGVALHTAAQLELMRDCPAEALALLERASVALDQAGPKGTLDRAAVMLTMAEVLRAGGKLEQAMQLHHQVLTDVEAVEATAPEHADALNALTARVFFGLGGGALQRGDSEPAKDYLARSVEFFEAAYAPGHPELREALGEIADMLRAMDEPEAAATVEAEIDAVPASDEGSMGELDEDGDAEE